MNSLLFEIGTEEIPAGYIEPALSALSGMLLSKLENVRIGFGSTKTFGTPRRLAVIVNDVSGKQEEKTEEVTGPPEKVGFDADGKPTMAAVKFAEKVGIPVSDIRIKETPKGKYLCADKTEAVSDTITLLKGIFPSVIDAIPFPKTMRWADLDVSFARPIQSILALFGDEVVPFVYGNITSGNLTRGHRFLKPDAIEIKTPESYRELLRDAFVMADIEERRKQVHGEINKVAGSIGGKILPDEALVDIVKNLIEYPAVVAGSFDPEYLELPDEILITAMREHQKYFAVIDANGDLLPNFVVVNNTRTQDMRVVTRGHEKVLRARLSDAQFFYRGDVKLSSEDRVKKLEGVLFQADLGTMLEKTSRLKILSEFISDMAGADNTLKGHVSRAAGICKADLVSQVVGEFPKLQGVMGRIYATVAKEPTDVAMAIEEHYRPTSSGGALPVTYAGSLLAIADKIDTLCGCFFAGLIPSGASDPYALRRQSIGLVQIMKDKGLSISLTALIEKGVSLYKKETPKDTDDITQQIYGFIKSRISHIMEEEGFSKDVIASVVNVSVDNVPQVFERVKALEKLKALKDFEPIAVAFKRVVNIIRKAVIPETVRVNKDIFQDACENNLYQSLVTTRTTVDTLIENRNYDQALIEIASLRDPVDAFFDGVMVMADDEALRNNRLALLNEISVLFGRIADFSMIST
ncbi:MAG: glycine--tRNA ligase subunit beta [Proteobacteria bacterium]|nr:glycine--tRNA ligase subunit beta [Pseudomonadota bacterium]